ncbi:hypothetical protein CRG98_008176 [Punica granatum]|uniref:Uncharacterized protein n=1 Tax=Punica granatum TaxID=22663 RepID=A0A2I0KSI1_PUNGR|nr:hypothetical protein CRG98_008176 [Punica granatum]
METRQRRSERRRGCARVEDSRTVTTSSRESMRVVRDPSNAMARLAEVASGNGTLGKSGAPGEHPLDSILFTARIRGWGPRIENLSPEMDLEGGKYIG